MELEGFKINDSKIDDVTWLLTEFAIKAKYCLFFRQDEKYRHAQN